MKQAQLYLTTGCELELKELMTKLPLVTDVISAVKFALRSRHDVLSLRKEGAWPMGWLHAFSIGRLVYVVLSTIQHGKYSWMLGPLAAELLLYNKLTHKQVHQMCN